MNKYPRFMVALVTPFLENGEIDYKSLVNLFEHCVHTGVEGIVLCGTTGECSALTLKEKEDILRFILTLNHNRLSIWMNCGSNNTAETLECSMMAAQYPIDGIMLITPYYVRPSQQGLYAHFKTIADRVNVPIMLYNVPKRTGVELTSETVIKLCSACSNIIALKQASDNFEDTEKILAHSHCKVYCGDDGLLLEGLSIGMEGIVSVAGHLYGNLILRILNQFDLGIEDKESAEKLKKITRAIFQVSSPSDIKALLSKHGLCKDTVRLPLTPLSEEEKNRLMIRLSRI